MFRLGGCGGGNGIAVFDPQAGSFGFESVGVPYQAMFTRPSSPALIQAKTLLCKTPSGDPEVSICIGVDQVLPSLVEYEYMSTVSPSTVPLASAGACSQTA